MDLEFNSYGELEAYLNAQLHKGTAYGAKTSLQCALDAKEAIAQADTHGQKMGAVARYGAEFKRWHHLIILHCTHIALKGRTVSRANVRHWQKAVFGKSMASSELRMYADSTRGAGDKVDSLLPSNPQAPLDDASLLAKTFFEKHKDLLKAKASPDAFKNQLELKFHQRK